MTETPTTNGDNGRGPNGRFLPGNSGGPGNPHAAKVAKLRAAALNAVKPKELAAVIRKLLEMALAGDVPAAREVLQRCLGPAEAIDIEARLSELETLLQSKGLL